MNLSKSGYVNHRMVNLKMDVVRMAAGEKPVTLRGYTLRAMKMGPTIQDNKDWRSICMKCKGEGKIHQDQVTWPVKEIDLRGRFCVCFACNEKGVFVLPKIQDYKDMLVVWLMGKVETERFSEIERVCQSEIEYITKLGRNEGWDNVPYEVEIGHFWRWVERRLNVVRQGGSFFGDALSARHIKAYNMQQEDREHDTDPEYNYTNEEVDERAQEASEQQIKDMDIDDAIQAAFARLEALLA